MDSSHPLCESSINAVLRPLITLTGNMTQWAAGSKFWQQQQRQTGTGGPAGAAAPTSGTAGAIGGGAEALPGATPEGGGGGALPLPGLSPIVPDDDEGIPPSTLGRRAADGRRLPRGGRRRGGRVPSVQQLLEQIDVAMEALGGADDDDDEDDDDDDDMDEDHDEEGEEGEENEEDEDDEGEDEDDEDEGEDDDDEEEGGPPHGDDEDGRVHEAMELQLPGGRVIHVVEGSDSDEDGIDGKGDL